MRLCSKSHQNTSPSLLAGDSHLEPSYGTQEKLERCRRRSRHKPMPGVERIDICSSAFGFGRRNEFDITRMEPSHLKYITTKYQEGLPGSRRASRKPSTVNSSGIVHSYHVSRNNALADFLRHIALPATSIYMFTASRVVRVGTWY